MVVSMFAWPMYALTSVSGNACTASVPKTCLRSCQRSCRSPAAFLNGVVALAELVAVDVLADVVDEHEVVRAGEAVAAGEVVERAGGLVDQRHAADAVRLRPVLTAGDVAPAHVNDALREVDVTPPKAE